MTGRPRRTGRSSSTSAPLRPTPSGSRCSPTPPGSGCCTRCRPHRLADPAMRVGDLAAALGVSQSTCSHHVELLAQGRLRGGRQGRHLQHGVGERRLLHWPPARRRRRDGHPGHPRRAARGPARRRRHPPSPTTTWRRCRHLRRRARDPQRHVRDEGTHRRPAARQVAARPDLGRRARRRRSSAGPPSTRCATRECYTGVGETSASTSPRPLADVASGKALLFTARSPRPTGQACGPCRRRSSPRTGPSLALHHSAGYRTLAVRTRIAQLDGVWRDTVLLERRSDLNFSKEDLDQRAWASQPGTRSVRSRRPGRSPRASAARAVTPTGSSASSGTSAVRGENDVTCLIWSVSLWARACRNGERGRAASSELLTTQAQGWMPARSRSSWRILRLGDRGGLGEGDEEDLGLVGVLQPHQRGGEATSRRPSAGRRRGGRSRRRPGAAGCARSVRCR